MIPCTDRTTALWCPAIWYDIRMSEKFPEYEAPDFRQLEASEYFDYEGQIIDYEDLPELNRTINLARKALYKTTEQINHCERLEQDTRLKYERAHRRAYLSSTGKTETERKTRADLATEDLENDWIAYKQAKSELIRIANAVRIDLQTLQALGNNIRQQLKM